MQTFENDLPEFWPRRGDRLFVQTTGPTDAFVSYGDERLYRMKKAFKTTADLLVTHTEDNPQERCNLLWPIIYCYRHYIELALKDVIAEHGSRVNPAIPPDWRNHSLQRLWQSYKKVIDSTFFDSNTPPLPESQAVDACIAEIEKVDPQSFTFRYPTNTCGNETTIDFYSIDLLHLRGVMEGIYNFLSAVEMSLETLSYYAEVP